MAFHTPTPPLLLEHFYLRYPETTAFSLEAVDLRLAAAERLALVGPSGCGKSSLARAVLGLLPPGSETRGRLQLSGQDPFSLSAAALRSLRGKAVGLVFQDPMTRLNPLLSIGDHLRDLLVAHGHLRGGALREEARGLLERVGIGPERLGDYPHQFSGGMRQRVAIALAMALRPPLVIADEPTTSLDVCVAARVMEELCSLCEASGSALLLITHDLALAGSWCERMAVMEQGRLLETSSAARLLTRPEAPLSRRLVRAARLREGGASPKRQRTAALLEVRELRCWHRLSGPLPWQGSWLPAVDGIDFSLESGETIGVVGASGCGKSTLCRALMGLVPLRGGSVLLRGELLHTLRGSRLRRARRQLQMVFQDPLACLNPAMTVARAIADPLRIHALEQGRGDRLQRVQAVLEQVGLTSVRDVLDRLPRQLSGGQQQRVAIARALILQPRVLICDEAVAMLDSVVQAEILALLRQLREQLGLAILLITHDLGLAASFCHRVLVLEQGRIVEEGPGDVLLRQGQAAATRRLIEACPRLPRTV